MQDHPQPVVVWFRQDLRLLDNPALSAAHALGRPIIALYILDDTNTGKWKMGGASRWWLHESLSALNADLQGNICFEKGDPLPILVRLMEATGAREIFWNRCYEPWRIRRDTLIKENLSAAGFDVKSFNASLLFEPHTVKKPDGTPYRVFTPYYKKGCIERRGEPPPPEAAPDQLNLHPQRALALEDLQLRPSIPWFTTMAEQWKPGETGAQHRLDRFLDTGITGYKDGRNFPTAQNVSRLSPHLHFGEISPRQAWHSAKTAAAARACETDGAHFLSELGWREFSNNLLYHFPHLTDDNLQRKFDEFPWRDDETDLLAWQQGQTGYPIIDAGMRELWQTGYMHNRVRMIVGSFLVKNLLLHWKHGAEWFWDTLLDADLANNSASWQWIAGCGADAAPYFRIFNPVTQGQKFDEDGDYVRRYVPELAGLTAKNLHAPWLAKPEDLHRAGIRLGVDYPKPMVDLKQSRERALAAFRDLT